MGLFLRVRVCVVMTADFLEFSKLMGNDLSTPRPEYGFEGLNDGDQWCLCATRWKEALDAGASFHLTLIEIESLVGNTNPGGALQ